MFRTNSKMKKIKQLANNAFVRPDRTEVLSEGLQEAEKRIDQIKVTCETVAKKVHACLQAQGKDIGIDKRIRKVPEFMLGSAMISIANGKQLGDGSVLGEVLAQSGQIEMKLGQEAVEFEVKIEEHVLKPLQMVMDTDLPNIYKLKRQLGKYTSDMDLAKAKVQQASRHSMTTQGGKIDLVKEEWEEAQQKVEQCRDNLAAEMYALIARESELSRLIVDFMNYQKEYHHSVYLVLNELISGVDSCVATSIHKPVFGLDLQEHLRTTQRTIAYPLELCVCGLMETAMEEEGLFRMAGSTSKVKKLKSAFDAGLMDLEGLLQEFCDPHVIANALKCYLRELPEPLLTFELYSEWMNAVRINESGQRLEALWFVVKKLPQTNHENLRYLVKFLRELSKHQEQNKMSPANIAIVIAPNLLWAQQANSDDLSGDQMGLNMTMTHHYSSVLDQLVSNSEYFFPEEIDFFVTCVKSEQEVTSKGQLNGVDESSSSEEQSQKTSQMKRSHSTSSVDDQSPPHDSPKPILRRKNKPAPGPPVQQPLNKNPLANVANIPRASPNKPNNRDSVAPSNNKGALMSEASRLSSKEKREGLWIPPSPKDTARKRVELHPPAKPPPPQTYQPSEVIKAREMPPKPESPLRKSSFKSNSVDKDKETEPLTLTRTPSKTSKDTDTLNNSGSPSSAFRSLPRHFHTENSYKNGARARPPSMLGIPPPAPPPVTNPKMDIAPTPEYEEPPTEPEGQPRGQGQAPLGFEKVELDLRKESLSSEEERPKVKFPSGGEQVTRPVPAPRSSLLVQSHSFKETSDNPVAVRERPSIMAKPRDLSRRTHTHSGEKEEPRDTPTSQLSQRSQEEPELPNNNGVELPPLSPTGKGPHRPPRPQPPAPPKKLTPSESTDL